MHTSKLVVVGVGHVGSYVLSYAMDSGLYSEIATIDINPGVSKGEAIDQAQSTGVPGTAYTYCHPGDYSDCADADVIIVAAGGSILPDPDDPERMPDRAELAEMSGAVVRDVMGNISAHTKDAVVIFITNPLDAMVHIATTEFDYPTEKIFGTGTMLDSARMRWIIGTELGIDPKSVTGYMMGEHGSTSVPILSRVNVQGLSWDELSTWRGSPLPTAPEIQERVIKAAYDVLLAKGWTNAGVSRSANELAKCVLLNEHSVHPICTPLNGEYGLHDVSMSVPTLIGNTGALRKMPPSLNDWELEQIHKSAEFIRETVQRASS